MDGNTAYYDISTIDLHLQTIQQYEFTIGKPLTLYELIELAIKDDNYTLINFLIFKRLAYIKTLIDNKTKKFNFMTVNLDMDKNVGCNIYMTDEQYYERLVHYANITGNGTEITIEDLIDEAYLEQDWIMMWYIYAHERIKIINFARKEDAKNDVVLL